MGWFGDGQPSRQPAAGAGGGAAAAALRGLGAVSLEGSRLGGALQRKAGARRAAFSQLLR
jgi:hypothetical protein